MKFQKLFTLLFIVCMGAAIVMNCADTSYAATKTTQSAKTEEKKATKKTKKVKKNKYTKSELRYMTSIIYCEAGNQSYAGKKAVGIVVMNRKQSRVFPSSIKRVIYQRGQFTPTVNGALNKALRMYDKGKFNKASLSSCKKAAKAVLNGDKTIKHKGKTKSMKGFYFFSRYVKNRKIVIGSHQFK